MSNYLPPEQITEYTLEVGVKKANNSFYKSFWLAFMGGMFIALATIASVIATSTIDNFSLAAVVGGLVFSAGLIMVVIAGGDLFTGNVLIIISVLQGKTPLGKMVRNLCTVFIGNLSGALFIVLLGQFAGVLENGNGIVVKKLMLKALHKMEYPFVQALLLGIMCNLLVCLAVWMMYSAKDTGGKVLACVFPITVFILSGYEHVVANMYYLPAAVLASTNAKYIAMAGLSSEQIAHLSISGIFNNFLPVMIGNLIGGLIIGASYHYIYLAKHTKSNIKEVKLSA